MKFVPHVPGQKYMKTSFHPTQHPDFQGLIQEIKDDTSKYLQKNAIIDILMHPESTCVDDHMEFYDIDFTCPSVYDSIFMESRFYNPESPSLFVRFKIKMNKRWMTFHKKLTTYPIGLINFYPGLLDIRIYREAFTHCPKLLAIAPDHIKNALLL